MISAKLIATLEKKPIASAADGYDCVQRLLAALHKTAPEMVPSMEGWFGGVIVATDKPFPFSERARMIEMLSLGMASSEPQMFSVFLDTARTGKRKPDQLELHYIPVHGVLQISVYRPTDSSLLVALLSALPTVMAVEYAFINVWDNDPDPEEPGDKTSYRSSFATFPHRQCLGWMAYVPQVVTMEQLPLAARIIPAKDGTIIVAVDEPFDLANKEHIKRANQIEMDMSDLGLLPVIDPSF
ncbi:MAG: hypothetical protein ACREP4_08090 [Stenotrophomonas sp.]|uniref:hypothetical protein n=1 Tax=Stenotrophomonas sp. TaxID=69392 RepID=UPI003D6D8148